MLLSSASLPIDCLDEADKLIGVFAGAFNGQLYYYAQQYVPVSIIKT
jgi:hypothetical protein